MLFTLKGIHALEKRGARKAADLARRTDPSIQGHERERRVREVVQTALLELDAWDFYFAIMEIGDCEAMYQTFFVLQPARESITAEAVVDFAVRAVAIPQHDDVLGERALRAAVKAVLRPWMWRRDRVIHRLARRNQAWLRRDFIAFIVKRGGASVLDRVQGEGLLFSVEERSKLYRARLGIAA